MSKPKALVTAAFNEAGLEYLRESYDVTYCNWMERGKAFEEDELIEMVGGNELIVTETDEFSSKVVEAAKDLKIFACCRGMKGNDGSIDLDALTARKIPVIYTPGRNTNAVAEHTIFMTLALMKKAKETTTWLYSNQWKSWLDFYLTFRTAEIRGKRVGILGFGQIGRRAAQLFNAFDAEVVAYDAFITDPAVFEAQNVKMLDRDEFFRTCDIISIHLNVSDSTRGTVGRKELEMMKDTAYLVNCSRAVVVDQEALMWAVKEKQIAGVALDVFYSEPATMDNEPLLAFSNVFCMPHMGGSTNDVIDNQSAMVVDGLKALNEGKQPEFILNPEVLG